MGSGWWGRGIYLQGTEDVWWCKARDLCHSRSQGDTPHNQRGDSYSSTEGMALRQRLPRHSPPPLPPPPPALPAPHATNTHTYQIGRFRQRVKADVSVAHLLAGMSPVPLLLFRQLPQGGESRRRYQCRCSCCCCCCCCACLRRSPAIVSSLRSWALSTSLSRACVVVVVTGSRPRTQNGRGTASAPVSLWMEN